MNCKKIPDKSISLQMMNFDVYCVRRKLDKDFVFEMVSQDHFAISAVSDKDIVFEILSKDNDAIEFVSDELLEDSDFTKKIKDELKIDL